MKAILTNVSHVAKDCLLWADSSENCCHCSEEISQNGQSVWKLRMI